MPMPELRDYAAERLPQRFRAPLRGEMPRYCPLRGRLLYCDEGPHATSWLAYRGDTVRLRNGNRYQDERYGYGSCSTGVCFEPCGDFGGLQAMTAVDHGYGGNDGAWWVRERGDTVRLLTPAQSYCSALARALGLR